MKILRRLPDGIGTPVEAFEVYTKDSRTYISHIGPGGRLNYELEEEEQKDFRRGFNVLSEEEVQDQWGGEESSLHNGEDTQQQPFAEILPLSTMRELPLNEAREAAVRWERRVGKTYAYHKLMEHIRRET